MEPKRRGPWSILWRLAVVVATLAIFSIGGRYTYSFAEKKNYDGCYDYKISLLKKASKNQTKVVIIGGSATNFGFHADLFQQQTGISTYNLGFSAGVSFDSYIASVMPYLNDGDYLFLAPEYTYYSGEFHMYGMTSEMFYTYSASAVPVLSGLDYSNRISNKITLGWTGWWNSLNFAFKSAVHSMMSSESSVYDFYRCNDNGDLLNHENRNPVSFTDTAEKMASSSFSFINELDKFINDHYWSKKINYRFVPTPVISSFYEVNSAFLSGVDQALKEETPYSEILPHSAVVFSKNDFFDSSHHLTFEAGKKYTSLLSSAFLSQLA
jgi:hypothetical protein